MTARELARQLNGRERWRELQGDDERVIADAGLVVVYGANAQRRPKRGRIRKWIEFRGAVHRTVRAWDGARVRAGEHVIEAAWWVGDAAWQFRTRARHATFEVVQVVDGERQVYSRGMVLEAGEIA